MGNSQVMTEEKVREFMILEQKQRDDTFRTHIYTHLPGPGYKVIHDLYNWIGVSRSTIEKIKCELIELGYIINLKSTNITEKYIYELNIYTSKKKYTKLWGNPPSPKNIPNNIIIITMLEDTKKQKEEPDSSD